MRRGRILAIKWGMNPNSSSLGVDVTFLLVGATVLAAVTPLIGALLRWRRPVSLVSPAPMTITCRSCSDSKIFSASSTATEPTDVLPRWMLVSVRIFLATLNAL